MGLRVVKAFAQLICLVSQQVLPEIICYFHLLYMALALSFGIFQDESGFKAAGGLQPDAGLLPGKWRLFYCINNPSLPKSR